MPNIFGLILTCVIVVIVFSLLLFLMGAAPLFITGRVLKRRLEKVR